MPQRLGRALFYAVLIWITGFVWGTVVFMTPALKSISSIPYISRYPAISFPLLVIWPLVAYVLARNYLRAVTDQATEGLKLGFMFAVVNLLLDLLVLVLLFQNGLGYFVSFTVWLAYFILLTVPWLVGRSLANRP
ncbi:MAG TPA: hypothetical protein VIF64_10970 [Pyrinomonadaceae bacterium]|jgi:hypothetical protein